MNMSVALCEVEVIGGGGGWGGVGTKCNSGRKGEVWDHGRRVMGGVGVYLPAVTLAYAI